MGKSSHIQWCDSTVNPVMGCVGCELWCTSGANPRKVCYAGTLHEMRAGMKGYAPEFGLPTLFPGRMAQAARWSDLSGANRPGKPWLNGYPRTIFVSDMGDALSPGRFVWQHDLEVYAVKGMTMPRNRPGPGAVQGTGVPFEFLEDEIIDTVTSERGSRHVWQWLTKQVPRLRQFDAWLGDKGRPWPPNLWMGTTVTSRSNISRAQQLAEIGDDHTIRFLSVEPLWSEVSFRSLLGSGRIHWVVVAGESTQANGAANEFKLEWARSLLEECKEFDVPFFLKQIGANATVDGKLWTVSDSHGGDDADWPADLRVREMPQLVAHA